MCITKEEKETIRQFVMQAGADVCGFASVQKGAANGGFSAALPGFHPCDVWADCRAVISFGVALPKGVFEVNPRIIYNRFNEFAELVIDGIALKTAKYIEETKWNTAQKTVRAVPVPSDSPYDYWNEEKLEGRGIISMKEAAIACGLGQRGKNTLLLNAQYGNRLILGAVLTDISIESDKQAPNICLSACHACLDACPVHALNGKTANQSLCRPNSYTTNTRGFSIVDCNRCRAVCPMRNGKQA